MIEVKTLIRRIRFKAQDNNEAFYSDYDIIGALNEVLDYLNNALSLQNSDFLEKEKEYENKDVNKGVSLPYDFITLVGITDKHGRPLKPCGVEHKPRPWEYKIFGNKIYCGITHFKIQYRSRLEEITTDKDTIMLPVTFTQSLVNLALLVLTHNATELQQAVNDVIMAIVPRRRYVNARIKMPFKV